MIRISLTLSLILILSRALQFTYAQPSQTYLNLHNTARRTASVPPPPVQWNDSIAATANMIARTCQGARTSLGINAYLGPRRTGVAGVMALWVRQRGCYIPFAEACIPNCQCRQYRQIVWRATTLIGCGRRNNCPGGRAMTVCLYWPGASVNEEEGEENVEYEGVDWMGTGFEKGEFGEAGNLEEDEDSEGGEVNIEYEEVEDMENDSEGDLSDVEEDEDSQDGKEAEFVNDEGMAWVDAEAKETEAEEEEVLEKQLELSAY